MIISFKLAEEKIVLTENDLKSIIVGDRVAGASDFEFTLNSYSDSIANILYSVVYINGKRYIATDIEYHRTEEEEEWIVSGIGVGDYILEASIAREDYAYKPNERGDRFLMRVLQDSVPRIDIEGSSDTFIVVKLSDKNLVLDLKPPKRGDRISEWLTKQLNEIKYVYSFDDQIMTIGKKIASSNPVRVFTNCVSLEKKKGDYWDSFWFKSDPFIFFVRNNEKASKPYHDVRSPNRPYHSVRDNAPNLLASIKKVITLSNDCEFKIERYATNSGEYVVMLRLVGSSTGYYYLDFGNVFNISDYDNERELMNIISRSGCTYHYDNGQYDEIQTGQSIRMWSSEYYGRYVPGSWGIDMPKDEDWPADNMYWRHGFLLAKGSTSNINTDKFQCPNGFSVFEGISLLEPLFSNEKTVANMEIDSENYKSLGLLDRVAFGIERIAKPQICTEKVLTMEDGQVHYDIKLDDQI